MGSSNPVTLEVLPPMTKTFFEGFSASPLTGGAGYTVHFQGILTDIDNQFGTSIVNGETIVIQIFDGAVWRDTATTTVTYGSGGYNGIFNVDMAMPNTIGQYQYRAYYYGNVAKNLEGCDPQT